jgi:hypothetical protein
MFPPGNVGVLPNAIYFFSRGAAKESSQGWSEAEPLERKSYERALKGRKIYFSSSFAPSGLLIIQIPTRGSLRSPLATLFRRFAAEKVNGIRRLAGMNNE